jgi:hypothetical protein
MDSKNCSIPRDLEAVLFSRALGFVFPIVTGMIIGLELADGLGALIGLLAGCTIGFIFNSFLSRLVTSISAILFLAAIIGIIALMLIRL